MRGSIRRRFRRKAGRSSGPRDDAQSDLIDTSSDESNDETYSPDSHPASDTLTGGMSGREKYGKRRDRRFPQRYERLNKRKPTTKWDKIPTSIVPLRNLRSSQGLRLSELPDVFAEVDIRAETRLWSRLVISSNYNNLFESHGGNKHHPIWTKTAQMPPEFLDDDDMHMVDLTRHTDHSQDLTEQSLQTLAFPPQSSVARSDRHDTPCSSCQGTICSDGSVERDVASSQTSSRTAGSISPMPDEPDMIPTRRSNLATYISDSDSDSEEEEDDDFQILEVVCATNPETPIAKPVGFMTRTYHNVDVEMCD